MHLVQPNHKALPHTLFAAVGKGVQGHKDAHLVFVLVLPVDAVELFQVDSVVPDVPVVLLQQSGKLFVAVQHVPSRLLLQDLVEVRVFCPPPCPILADSTCDIEHFGQCILDLLL